jgi:holo-[acyl-carrier protein] synthase
MGDWFYNIMEIGVDCVEIERFNDILNDIKLLHKIFTPREIEYCKQRNKFPQHFAVRFAAKEAVIKALSHYNIRIPFNKIEIVNEKDGRPFVKILDNQHNSLRLKISLSHSNKIAIAFALVDKP